VDNKIVIDELFRSRRKTVTIQVSDTGKLIVRAPFHTSNVAILQIINKHAEWIIKKQSQILKNRKNFTDNELFLFLGKTYKLHIVENQKQPLIFKNNFYLSENFLQEARKIFIRWYRNALYAPLLRRVKMYAEQHDFNYNKVKISLAEKRWGSCSSKGNLNFSWRLAMADLSIIDYIVVHELVHLKIRNHSRMFWEYVGKIMPCYKKYDTWLKNNGSILML